MARLLNVSADVNPRWMEACWVASGGLPVADSALIAAAMGINAFAVLLWVASLAALGGPAKIEFWLVFDFGLDKLYFLFFAVYGDSDWG